MRNIKTHKEKYKKHGFQDPRSLQSTKSGPDPEWLVLGLRSLVLYFPSKFHISQPQQIKNSKDNIIPMI